MHRSWPAVRRATSPLPVTCTCATRASRHYPLGDLAADLGGTFDDMRLRDITLDGPRGRFRGDGAVARGVFGVRGTYDGSLADLRVFTGDIGGRGDVHAPVAALVDDRGVTVQTSGAVLTGGSIHGVALGAASGTMLIAGTSVRIITGSATLDGAHAVAAARDGETAISMVGVPAAAFAGSGLPLDAGRVSVFGLGNLDRPDFHGSIDLDRGRAMGFPVGGWVDIALTGRTSEHPRRHRGAGRHLRPPRRPARRHRRREVPLRSRCRGPARRRGRSHP